jgi:hypothetical protein
LVSLELYIYIYIFVNYFAKLYDRLKFFCRFGNQPPCATAVSKETAMAHDGKSPPTISCEEQARGSLPPWATAVRATPIVGHGGRLIPPWGRRLACLYKGRQRPPPLPPLPPQAAPSSPRPYLTFCSLFFINNLIFLVIILISLEFS